MFKVRDSIKEQLKKVPQTPGVYLMKDQWGKIIYVGKAKRLKNRLNSYFTRVESHPNKTKTLVINIAEFDYILVSTEEEALLLEANLIKKYQPKFNVLLKDDKSYPFVLITDEKYPQVIMTRDPSLKGKFYGPYTSAYHVSTSIKVLKDLFPIRRCSFQLDKVKSPCLYYHLEQCIAPCVFEVKEEHDALIQKIRVFFDGNQKEVKERLLQKRDLAAKELRFEDAIVLRDEIEALQSLQIYQKVLSISGEDHDYLAMYRSQGFIIMVLFIYRNGKMISMERFSLDDPLDQLDYEVLESFMMQYYVESSFIPKKIYIQLPLEGKLQSVLSEIAEHKVELVVPKIGEHKQILENAKRNAMEYLLKFEDRIHKKKEIKAEIELALTSLTSREKIQRIEAYDISNLFGALSVASMVVYEEFEKKTSDYRKFRIKHVKGPNDVASMQEVLSRRIKRLQEKSFGKAPDLIILDGGSQQVHAVEKVLQEYSQDISVLGLVKDDHHRTQAIFYQDQEYPLDKNSHLYRFLYAVQEEMHRFALSYHQKLRGKSLAFSILDEIQGVGEVRKKNLLSHFGSLEKIQKAGIEQLEEVEGISKKVAEEIYRTFHEE